MVVQWLPFPLQTLHFTTPEPEQLLHWWLPPRISFTLPLPLHFGHLTEPLPLHVLHLDIFAPANHKNGVVIATFRY